MYQREHQKVKIRLRITCAVILIFLLMSPAVCFAEDDPSILDNLMEPQLESGEMKDLQKKLDDEENIQQRLDNVTEMFLKYMCT
jgi:hypothetical protein